jgi:hypothetical protein
LKDPTEITPSDLAAHIQRFDKIFETVAMQVYTLNESAEVSNFNKLFKLIIKINTKFKEITRLLYGTKEGHFQ